jgi:hypothetical protein
MGGTDSLDSLPSSTSPTPSGICSLSALSLVQLHTQPDKELSMVFQHGDWDNLRLYNKTAGLGPEGSDTYHGSDLNMLFGTAEDVSGLHNSAAVEATSKHIMGAWAKFARNSHRGLTTYGWPADNEHGKLFGPNMMAIFRLTPAGETLVQLAYNSDAKPAFVNPAVYDRSCRPKYDPLPRRGAF